MQFAEGRAGLGDIQIYAPELLSQTTRFGEQLSLLVQNMMSDPVASVRLLHDPSEVPASLGAFNAPELLPKQGGASIKSLLDGLQKSHTLYEQAAAQTQVRLEAGSYATDDERQADLQRYLAFLSSAQGCVFAQIDILVGLQKDRGAQIDFLANANPQGVSTELLSGYFKWKADSAFCSARNLYGDRTLVEISGDKSTYLNNSTFVSAEKFLAVKNEWDRAASMECRKDADLRDWIAGNFSQNESLNKECGEFLAKLQGSIQRRLNEGVIVDGVSHPATVDSPLFGSVSANTANMWDAIGHASLAGLALSVAAATAPIGGWVAAAGFLAEKGYFTSVAATQYNAGDKLGAAVFLTAIWAGPLARSLGALKVSRGIIYPITGAGMASGVAVGVQMAASGAGTIGDMKNYGFTPEGIVSIAEASLFTAGAIHGYGGAARKIYDARGAAVQMGKAAAARLKNLKIKPVLDAAKTVFSDLSLQQGFAALPGKGDKTGHAKLKKAVTEEEAKQTEEAPKQQEGGGKNAEESGASTKLSAPLPQTGGGYKLGCIFPKLKQIQPEDMKPDLTHRNRKDWDFDNTPLSAYASATFHFPRSRRLVTQTYFNFEEYLEKLILDRKNAGIKEPLRILDIGMGTGKQWIPFIEKHGKDVTFSGTTLLSDNVDPAMEKYTVKCDVLGVPNHFKPNEFDVVVSRHAMYGQELVGVEVALFEAKIGGEVVITGLSLLDKLPKSRRFQVIEKDEHPLRANFYHLRKLKHPATGDASEPSASPESRAVLPQTSGGYPLVVRNVELVKPPHFVGLKWGRIRHMISGTTGMSCAAELLEKRKATGVLVGGLAKEHIFGNVVRSHKDTDIAVLDPHFQLKYQREGCLDWFLPEQVKVAFEAGGGKIEETVLTCFVNHTGQVLRFGIESARLLSSGLYLPDREFVLRMMHHERKGRKGVPGLFEDFMSAREGKFKADIDPLVISESKAKVAPAGSLIFTPFDRVLVNAIQKKMYGIKKLAHLATEQQQVAVEGKPLSVETAKIQREVPTGTYFEKALLESRRLGELGFSVAVPELPETQLWRLARAASRAADRGMDAVNVGHNLGLGKLTQTHVGFAQGYSLIAQSIPREYLETPGEMLKYLVAEKAPGYAERGFFSDFTLAMHGNEVAGVITGAIIRIGNNETMLFTGYRIVRDSYRGKGVSHMLMNAAIERSVRELGIEPSYLVGEAESPKEIAFAKSAGKFFVTKINYRQPNLENMAGSVFENCEPLALMLGMRAGNERISFQELHEVVKRLYEYYGLRGERLAGFLAKTFANVPQNTEWVRNSNGEFVPR